MTIRFLALCALVTLGCGAGQRSGQAAEAPNRSADGASTAIPSSTPAVVNATQGRVAISIRLAGELDDALRDELEALGMQWTTRDGELAHIGPIYSGSAPAENTAAMQALEGVVRVEQSGRAPVVAPKASLVTPPPWHCNPARALPPAASCTDAPFPPTSGENE